METTENDLKALYLYMIEDEMQEKEALKKLINDFELTVESTKGIDFAHFSSFNKGDNFRIIYAWKLTNLLQSIYLVKYYNSYRLSIVAPQLGSYSPHTEIFKHLCLYTKLAHTIPDFTIRPNTVADKFVNLFLRRSTKVKEFPKFNHKYILESRDLRIIEQVIGTDFFTLILDTNGLNVEVKDHKCLIWGLKPLDYHYYRVMIQLSEEIVKRSIVYTGVM